MPTCLIDLRCLQDPGYRDRGIGRHARVLLGYARTALPGWRLAGVTDSGLPPLTVADRALVDIVRVSAYTGGLNGPCCFVQLSPMTHDPLFVARLLNHSAIPSATAVYDFIPLGNPDIYLSAERARTEYYLGLRWLARYTLFLPISADTAAGLREVLGVPASRIAITGAPLGPAYEQSLGRSRRHVLVVSGNEARKNPEVVVRAHAQATTLQRGRVPLVITGEYSSNWLDQQRDEAERRGGDPDLIEACGHVDEASLLDLYARAHCVVVPSRAEGFSLPVVEAMAAGVPVLASDIPAHQELLEAGLFGPDDDDALAVLLTEAMEPAWRNTALIRQSDVWPRFRADAVAARFWAGVARLQPASAPSVSGRRPCVAMLTPLPPSRSGVADYSAACCAALGERVDVHLFTPTPGADRPAGAASLSPLSAIPFLAGRFDRVVSVLGNSVFHLDILRMLLRYGGAAILHDGRMLDVYAGHMGLERTIEMAEAELGRRLREQELWAWLAGDLPPAALVLSEIAVVAEPLMMHSQAGVAEVSRRYGAEAKHLPFCLYRSVGEDEISPAARAAARARLGVGPGQVLVASFGYVHPSKAPVDCIWALLLLRSWGIDACLHFVGSSIMVDDVLTPLVAELGLDPYVRLPGAFVDERIYRDHLVGADLGIQLRTTGPGSVSGALADCIAVGLPTVASQTLADALDAPAYVRAVPDFPSPVLVANAAAALLGTRPTSAARLKYVAEHGFDRYADRLCQALSLA